MKILPISQIVFYKINLETILSDFLIPPINICSKFKT